MSSHQELNHVKEINGYLQTEINELKAKIDLIKKLHDAAKPDIVSLFQQQPQNMSDGSYLIDGQSCFELEMVISSAPELCLVNVKADAEKKGYWQGFETGSVFPSGNILQMYNGWLDLKATNEAYADNLRKTMITTSSESSLSEVVNKINEEL